MPLVHTVIASRAALHVILNKIEMLVHKGPPLCVCVRARACTATQTQHAASPPAQRACCRCRIF